MTKLDFWLIALSVVSFIFTVVVWRQMKNVNTSILVKQSINIHFEQNINIHVERNNVSRLVPFVFSLNYWEQTGNALKNLFDIQCWARSVNIDDVLEPAIVPTRGNAFLFSVEPNATFKSYFDIHFWNSLNRAFNNSILVPLHRFWTRACRKILLIQLLFDNNSVCQPLNKFSMESWYKTLERNGFTIDGVCIDTRIKILDDYFREFFFEYNNSCSTILFTEWRGISAKKNFRLQLQKSRCQNVLSFLMSSKLTDYKPKRITYPDGSHTPVRFSENVLKFRDQFLSEYINGEDFVTVIIRTEKLNKSLLLNKKSRTLCINDIVRDHKEALRQTNATRTLYFTDLGPHGSSSWWNKNNMLLAVSFSQFIESAINPLYSTAEIDDQMELVTKSNDSILIALLQSAIATKAEALVMVGEGAFHSLILNFHAHGHVGNERHFIRNSQCSRKYLHHFYA